ncbi:MAG: hypothetical protein ACOY5C_03395 [Pseudomonadota bacterium]|uniref:hypothetical protein n=1 Tax=Thermithiobacillus tepidarius TaxID=929 RepID=UPI000686D4C1|nr:hypothetical protein [Thermithiobacillus tepidarius]
MEELNKLLKAAMQRVAELNEKGILLGRKRYTTVAQRNEVFREIFGVKGRILTEIVEANDERVIVLARIEFFHDGQWVLIGNGYAEERRNSSQVNRTSAIENCETSAVGRALANLGLHGGEYASANEVENAIHQQQEVKVDTVTVEQQEHLRTLADEVHADVDKMLAFFHVASFAELPAKDYNRAVKMLEKKRRAAA